MRPADLAAAATCDIKTARKYMKGNTEEMKPGVLERLQKAEASICKAGPAFPSVEAKQALRRSIENDLLLEELEGDLRGAEEHIRAHTSEIAVLTERVRDLEHWAKMNGFDI